MRKINIQSQMEIYGNNTQLKLKMLLKFKKKKNVLFYIICYILKLAKFFNRI